jgi:hypothetical protein
LFVFTFIIKYITYYSVQLLSYIAPTSLSTGYTAPSNFDGYPATSTAPSFIVLNNNFTNFIGFVTGTYEGGPSNSSINSSYTLQAQLSIALLSAAHSCQIMFDFLLIF